MIYQSDYKWATGFNNAGAFAVVESDVPLYQGRPMIVRGRGRFIDGTAFERADAGITTLGKRRFTWLVPVMGLAQYAYIRSTYCASGYSGQMTVRTRNSLDTFANYSATLHVPTLEELRDSQREDSYRNVVLTFVVEAAL